MNRRRRRRKHSSYRNNNTKKSAVAVVMVICLSIAAGYLTATKVLAPALGLDAEKTIKDFVTEKKDGNTEGKSQEKDKSEKSESQKTVVEDTLNVEQQGFAVQYGSFSSESGAREMVDELKSDGIDTEIIVKDGAFKVISRLFDTRDEAESHKETLQGVEDVFITQIP